MSSTSPSALPGAGPPPALDSLLERVGFLGDASAADRRELASFAIRHRYPRGNILFHHRDPCEAVFIVLGGRVKLTLMSEEGREVVLRTLVPGDSFGVVAALDGGRHLGNAITASDCQLARFERDRFLGWLTQRPHLHHRLLVELAGVVRSSYEKIGVQALLPVKKRLYVALLEIARTEGRHARGEEVVFERPTHQELAERVGSTRVVVSRILKELLDEEPGLSAEGKVIRLPLSALVVRESF